MESMKRHIIMLTVLVLVLALGVILFIGTKKAEAPSVNPGGSTSGSKAAGQQSANPGSPGNGAPDCAPVKNPVIIYQNDSFSPACVTVKSGAKVTFVNKSPAEIAVGADPHPSHSGNREISDGQFTMQVPAGGQASAVLTTPGNYGYHNHLNPGTAGRVIVQ